MTHALEVNSTGLGPFRQQTQAAWARGTVRADVGSILRYHFIIDYPRGLPVVNPLQPPSSQHKITTSPSALSVSPDIRCVEFSAVRAGFRGTRCVHQRALHTSPDHSQNQKSCLRTLSEMILLDLFWPGEGASMIGLYGCGRSGFWLIKYSQKGNRVSELVR